MEKIEEGYQNLEGEKLYQFREEIRNLILKESEEGETAHLQGLNPEELNLRDMQIWQVLNNFKDGDDVQALKNNFDNYRLDLNSFKPLNRSRSKFCAFIANKITPILSR